MSYAVPMEGRCDEDDARLVHADLAMLDLDDLDHEAARVVVALAAVDRHHRDRPWLLARLRAVRAAIATLRARATPRPLRTIDHARRLRRTA